MLLTILSRGMRIVLTAKALLMRQQALVSLLRGRSRTATTTPTMILATSAPNNLTRVVTAAWITKRATTPTMTSTSASTTIILKMSIFMTTATPTVYPKQTMSATTI